MAELILNGQTTEIDIAPLSAQRFREPRLIHEAITMHGVTDFRNPTTDDR